MKRLVTQFDDTRMRATVATPTCCCCCCCCVTTLLTSSALTALNLQKIAKANKLPPEKSTLIAVLGFLIIPSLLLMIYYLNAIRFQFPFPLFFPVLLIWLPALWAAILYVLYRIADDKSYHVPTIVGTVIATAIAFFGEFSLGPLALSNGFLYLAVSLFISAVIITRFRKTSKK